RRSSDLGDHRDRGEELDVHGVLLVVICNRSNHRPRAPSWTKRTSGASPTDLSSHGEPKCEGYPVINGGDLASAELSARPLAQPPVALGHERVGGPSLDLLDRPRVAVGVLEAEEGPAVGRSHDH